MLRWLGSLPLVVRIGVMLVVVGMGIGYAWTAFGVRPSYGGPLAEATPEGAIAVAGTSSEPPSAWVPQQPGGRGNTIPVATPTPTPAPSVAPAAPTSDPNATATPNPTQSALTAVYGTGPSTTIEQNQRSGTPQTRDVPAIMVTPTPSARSVDVGIAHGNSAGNGSGEATATTAQSTTALNPDAVRAVLLAAQHQAATQTATSATGGTDARTPDDSIYSSHHIQHPRSDYELHIGDVIPAAFTRAVRSTQGGYVMAVATGDVCDHVHQRWLLVPTGAFLIGSFTNDVKFGQNTLSVRWTELDYPNGDYLIVDDMPSEDKAGGSGVSATVNAHYGTKLQNTIIPGILAALLQSPSNGSPYGQSGNVIGSMRDAVGTNVVDIATALAQKAADQPDTLSIPGQTQFNAVVNRRIAFEQPYLGRVCGATPQPAAAAVSP